MIRLSGGSKFATRFANVDQCSGSRGTGRRHSVRPQMAKRRESGEIEGVWMDVDEKDGGDHGSGESAAYPEKGTGNGLGEGRFLDQKGSHWNPVTALDAKLAISFGCNRYGERQADGVRKTGYVGEGFGNRAELLKVPRRIVNKQGA